MKIFIAICFLLAVAQAENYRSILRIKPTLPSARTNLPDRITNGEIATRGQFPYQVALIIDTNIFCGGSLIHKYAILTAAHCVQGFTTFQAHLGAQTISGIDETDRIIMDAWEWYVHEEYDPQLIQNDIAFIYLDDYDFNAEYIQTIRMPAFSNGDLYEGKMATVTGWGRASDNDFEVSNDLRFVQVPVISNQECVDAYGIIFDSNICTSSQDGKSSCSGDSGGPLAFIEDDGIATQIGIVSFGAAAGCEIGFPAGYTRISSFLDWIQYNSRVEIRP